MLDVLFVTPTERLELSYEVNGIMLLATKLLQAGYDVKQLRFCQVETTENRSDYSAFIRNMTDAILRHTPRCVSFYTLWPHYHIMLRLARELKKARPEIITILGGPQASATAQATMEATDDVDFICTGEGENTIVPFITALLKNDRLGLDDIPGLYHRKNGAIVHNTQPLPLCDLNTLPQWDSRLYQEYEPNAGNKMAAKTYYLPIDAGRGCPFSCTFCCSSQFWRRTYRLKSPERIMEDIQFYHEKFGVTSFWFSHDAFTTNNKLVSRVCDYILESGIDIQWRCTARMDCINEALIEKMMQAGMRYIELGVETGSNRMQQLINKRLKLDNVRQMTAFMRSKGLHVSLFFMYGFPEETEEDLQQTLSLLFHMIDSGVPYVSMNLCRFNPGTAMTQKHFDQLVLGTDVKGLSRSIMGYEEELPFIRANKALFPFFYHLDTPLRNTYQHLSAFVYLYRRFPSSIRYLRELYQGDDLRFYREFCDCNASCFTQSMDKIEEDVKQNALELFYNLLDTFDVPYLPQLKALMKLDDDRNRIMHSAEDIFILENYEFSYVDLKLKLPIQEFSQGTTKLLLQKVNNTFSMKILQIC